MITRTITVVKYELMVVNMDTLKVEYENVEIANADTMTEKVRDAILKSSVKSNQKFVQIMDCEKTEKLYGMTEDEFLKCAEELPPRLAKEIE